MSEVSDTPSAASSDEEVNNVNASANANANANVNANANANASNRHKRYRKPKPWDSESIDHWAIEPVTPETSLGAPVEESSFATLFPTYREKYLREVWPIVTRTLKGHGIKCVLDMVQGSMEVKTSRKTWDPAAILKARDMIKLLARSIPVQQAMKIMQDGVYTDIIKIKNMVRNKERFVKRRNRLIGPNGCTLKAIELVTDCYVQVQGNTVSAMGSIHGLKGVRKIVVDCMKNIHPIYNIKTLMIKRELMKDDTLKNENWDRFLPKFKKKNVKRKVPKQTKDELTKASSSSSSSSSSVPRSFTPFPPLPLPRLVDLELESGRFFMAPEEREAELAEERKSDRTERMIARRAERAAQFVPPTTTTTTATTSGSSAESETKSKSKNKNNSNDNNSNDDNNDAKTSKVKSKGSKRSLEGEDAGVGGGGEGEGGVESQARTHKKKKPKRVFVPDHGKDVSSGDGQTHVQVSSVDVSHESVSSIAHRIKGHAATTAIKSKKDSKKGKSTDDYVMH